MIEFDLIKKKIQHYSQTSLVFTILNALNAVQKNDKELYPFWRLLVLLKWSYLHASDIGLKKTTTLNDLNELLGLIEKFEAAYGGINLKSNPNIPQFFKIIAYQQFPYQDTYYNSILERQLILYSKTESGFDIDAAFKNRTGLSIIQFCSHCYFTNLYLNLDTLGKGYSYDGIFHNDFFEFFSAIYSKAELVKFLDLLTIRKTDDLNGLHRLNNEILQLYETNFYITKPFIHFLNAYRIPHRAVFLQTLSHFIYTFLKATEPDFPGEFGKRLEKYTELGLKELKREYFSEKQLQNKYSLKKVTDFLVEENILLEVKATELHPRSGVSRTSKIMANDMQDSIVKAYTQMLSVANSIDNKKEWYGIVITYKEMYLGFGPDTWEEFLQTPVTDFLNKSSIDINILPPGNLFFISISDWDWIIQALKDKKASSLKEILIKGKELNTSTDQQEKVFMMEQVLKRCFKIKKITLSYLKKAKIDMDILARVNKLKI